MTKILVSVIVPVFNRQNTLKACLDSLLSQSQSGLEILVGDDGSTDNSLEIAKSYQKNHPNLSVLTFKHRGPARVRNELAKRAKGDILVFVDSDMVADKDYITKLTEPIFSGKTKGTFTTEEFVENKQNKWAVCWNYEYVKDKTIKRIPNNHPKTSKVFRSILKSEFESVGGYSDIGYGEDWTLSQKLGYEADLATRALIHHTNPSNAREVFLQARWFATRPYKFGTIGRLFGLIRASLPVSFVLGVINSIRYKTPFYFLFKIIYDWGIFCGIIKYMATRKHAF